jgi:Mlc titration factor MtfA (ptsG expression regulator)
VRRRPDRNRIERDTLETVISQNVALAARLDGDRRGRLVSLTESFIRSVRWEAVAPVELTDEVVGTIAANAVVPVLGLDLGLYRNVGSIIVFAGTARSTGRRAGPVHGVYADDPIPVVGQAGPNRDPLSIGWRTARADSRAPDRGRNVVIHELAHKIDMVDGYSDGTPPLRGAALTRWVDLLDEQFRTVAGPDDALRPYAWSSPAEFFAVATEAFFCIPNRLRAGRPELYGALRDCYEQDPAADAPAPA